jgi:hypothetical protein
MDRAETRRAGKDAVEDQVILDPVTKDGSWAVVFGGKVVARGYNDRGVALAALSLYKSGYRKAKDAIHPTTFIPAPQGAPSNKKLNGTLNGTGIADSKFPRPV